MPSSADRERLLGRAGHLIRLTLAWNCVEALVAIAAGTKAGSISLIGFGLDSIIEAIAGTTILLHLRGNCGLERTRSRVPEFLSERTATKIVGLTFLALGLYVLASASLNLLRREVPAASTIGIILASLSLLVMPTLSVLKRRAGIALDCTAVVAESKETAMCAGLSIVLLLGLSCRAVFGWWWADPVAALAMTPWMFYEGWEALKGTWSRKPCVSHGPGPGPF